MVRWRDGIRLYIAIGVGLVTLEAWWWAEAVHGGTVLFATRLEEIYGWLAVGLVTLAVSIGPFYKLWPKAPGNALMRDARRLFGVGGAWFATLHVLLVYSALFKWANPLTLPDTYQRSFAAGILALLILLAMAFTSFDKAFHGMGVWWFRLHRFVYLALCLIALHVFLTGAHATQLVPLVALSVVAVIIVGMHTWATFGTARRPTKWQVVTLAATTLLLASIFAYGYQQYAQSSRVTEQGKARLHE